ncbi:hypothetical protein DPMN_145680 [Dreissena polymorpha]|uniref:Uncharacterized protein n=1 Tax=Dreissena polymorpha TaxID=45954 RepID=A0A9D4F4I0_DREPO|nr:hypothetical protein DPMN_145680 [Dreissena polymorpha]
MPKSKSSKRKQRNCSDNNHEPNAVKVRKQRGPSSDSDKGNVSVSDVLNKVNSVLFGVDNSVFDSSSSSGSTSGISETGSGFVNNMADSSAEPTIRDVMVLLKSASSRRQCLETKMSVMDSIEKRMESFEKEIKQLWVVHEERANKVEERVSRLEDKVGAAELAERVQDLAKERDTLRENVSYLQSQSMRNNLVFTAKPEANGNVFETPEMTEAKLRQHLVSAFKLSQEVANSI